MASPRQGKRNPTAGGPRRKTRSAVKDQLLCDLELQQTVSEAQIKRLEHIREELEASQQGFMALYERSPIGYVTLDRRGHIYDANKSAADLLGFTRNRLLHLPFMFFANLPDVRA